jgi:integrase
LASDKWRGYSKNTQDTHRKSLYGVRRAWGSKPLSFFDDPLVYSELLTWQGTLADTPGSADNFINVLSAVLKFGVNEGLVEENYAAGIPDLFDIRGRAHITWSRENLDRFVACSDRLGMPQVGDAALLAFECGMRPQDLRTAQEVHVQHDVLRKFALKSSPQGRRYYATIPRTADLDAVVARCRSRFRMEGVENLLVTPKGKAWRDFQLENAVRLVRNKAGIRYFDPKTGECEDLHLHDLRGTFATRLILTTDLCDEQIATLMGWSARSVASIRRVYVSDRARIRQIGKLLWTDL